MYTGMLHTELLHLFMIFVYIRCHHYYSLWIGQSRVAKIRKCSNYALFFTHSWAKSSQETFSQPRRLAGIIILIGVMIDCNKLLASHLCGKLQMILL